MTTSIIRLAELSMVEADLDDVPLPFLGNELRLTCDSASRPWARRIGRVQGTR